SLTPTPTRVYGVAQPTGRPAKVLVAVGFVRPRGVVSSVAVRRPLNLPNRMFIWRVESYSPLLDQE
ncbi:MAG: hypothetical protein RIT23_43, partial [Actinomycetota bacterium]